MGQGIDMARAAGAGIHAAVMDNFKDQLLIVFLKRLQAAGQSLEFPVQEIDDTQRDLLSFSVRDGVFQFKLSQKS
jgi:hypothetical protein